jgi:hypothetical protein
MRTLFATTTFRLHVAPRSADMTIVADSTLGDRLYDLAWTGAQPVVEERDREISIRYSLRGRVAALGGGTLALRLNPSIAWEIDLEGGVSGLRADLRGLRVASIAVSGGASDVLFDLPAPDGELALQVKGGASELVVRRPAGADVALAVDGGVSRLRFDDEEIGSIGGRFRREARTADHVALTIGGGASRLTVA